MNKLSALEPRKVFEYFEEICSIPHGSYNMDKINAYLASFATENSLEYYIDDAKNVVIYKEASPGYENAEAMILQGHIDMVCQKTDDCTIDFEKDGLDVYVEDGFVKARGTTLGADNGIAVAVMLAILSDDEIAHPRLECVFTSNEEVGMLGALALDMKRLTAKRMINMDGGGDRCVLISCAGGSDLTAERSSCPKTVCGTKLTLNLDGLPGGHSGVQINSGIENANAIMTKILARAYDVCPFEIISINGGNKTNVISPRCTAQIVTDDASVLSNALSSIAADIKGQLGPLNSAMELGIEAGNNGEYMVVDNTCEVIRFLSSLPSGVIAMSAMMENLVETSANIGIVRVTDTQSQVTVSVRSSSKTSLDDMLTRLGDTSTAFGYSCSVAGAYPPWELKKDTQLQKIYTSVYKAITGELPMLRAVHAGLECGVFDSAIEGLDCISIGPNAYDIHSTSERLDISSTKKIYEIISEVLKNCR